MGNKKSKSGSDDDASMGAHDEKEVDVSVVMLKIARTRKKVLDYVIHDIVQNGFYIPHYKRYKLTKEQVLLLWPDTSSHDIHVSDLYEGSSVSVIIAVKENSRKEMIALTKKLQQDHIEHKEDVIMCSQSDTQAAREIAVLFPEIVASNDLQECRMSHDEDMRLEAWEEVIVKLNTQRNGSTESVSFTNLVIDALIDCYENTGPPPVAVHEIPHKFPQLFDMYHWVREPLACGNGWYSLVYDTAKELDALGKQFLDANKDEHVHVHEVPPRLLVRHIVKDEKSGLLRIHTNAAELGGDILDEAEQITFKASHESSKICELCSQIGRMKKSLAQLSGQARVLCKFHQSQMKALVEERMKSIQAARGNGDMGVLTNDFGDNNDVNVDDEPYEIEVEERLSKHEYNALRRQIEKANRIAVKNAEKKTTKSSGGGGGGGDNSVKKKKKKKPVGGASTKKITTKKSAPAKKTTTTKKVAKKTTSGIKKKKSSSKKN